MNRPPLKRGQTNLIRLHGLAAIAFLCFGLITSADAGGWADLARIIVAALAGAYFLGASLSWLTARYLTDDDVIRYVVAAIGAPVVLILAIQFLRLA
ncbi:MAG: hypothetical protein ACFCVC_02495 [Acidimicrobiia bacterium]